MRTIAVLFSVVLSGNLLLACATSMPVDTASGLHSQDFKPALSVNSVRNYTYDYNQIVNSTAYNDIYVICRDRPTTTKLERKLGEVQIAVFWGKERVVSASTSSQPGQHMTPPDMTSVPAEKRAEQTEQTDSSRETAMIKNPDARLGSSVIRTEKRHEGASFTCITPPIQFDFDSAVLRDKEKVKIMASLDRLKMAKAITVKGYTCDAGSKIYNDRLALRRAEAVAGYLEEHGIKSSKVSGEGKCCYLNEESSKNRRAEINCLISKGE